MNTTIKITVSQPLPTMPKPPPFQQEPLKKIPDRNQPDPDRDLPSLAPPPNRPVNEGPFIPNDRDQYVDEPFEK
jgi:hypothetical protein